MDLPEEHIESFCKKYRLSPRESQVLRLILEGVDSNKKIAERLGVKFSTATSYIHDMYAKTGENSKLAIAIKVMNHK